MGDRIIGIDLGTTSSLVAVAEGSSTKLIPDSQGRTILPSIAVVKKDGSIHVGHEAERLARKYATDDMAIYSLKRVLDKTRSFTWGEVETYPQILTAIILAELKLQAEMYLGEKIDKAVIAVPANFNFFQRQFTKEAALIAGLQPIRIINEASAALFALQDNIEGTVVAADLGGGTFDVSAISCGDGVYEVLATSGDANLGGDDFTDVMYRLILRKSGMSQDEEMIRSDPVTHRRVRDAAEEAKKELSSSPITKVLIPYIKRQVGYDTLGCVVGRDEFENECKDLLERIESVADSLFVPPGRSGSLNMVGSVSTPQQRHFFPRLWEKIKDSYTIKPYHTEKTSQFPTQIDSLEGQGGRVCGVWALGNATRMPAVTRLLRSKGQLLRPRGLRDLKEPVAIGAAKQAGCLSGDLGKNILLIDTTPSSLGLELNGGVFVPLISKNTHVPTRRSNICTTTQANQTSITLRIIEGERFMARDNRVIAVLRLENILPAPAGVPQIEVVFDVDASGLLTTSARDTKTGKASTIVCNDFVLPERTLNEFHGAAQHWLDKRRRNWGTA
jgi:molecular chaperone DnaK